MMLMMIMMLIAMMMMVMMMMKLMMIMMLFMIIIHNPTAAWGGEKNALTGWQVLQLFEIILGIEQKQWFVWILFNMLQSVTEIQIK